MDRVTSTLIDLAEAAHNLDVRDSEWLAGIMSAGLPLLDHGLGVAGGIYARSAGGERVTLDHFNAAGAVEACSRRLARIAIEIRHTCLRPGLCMTLSEAAGEQYTRAVASWSSDSCARDALGLWALDSDGRGAFIIAPLFERTALSRQVRHRWQTVGTHFTTGFRLRRALQKIDAKGLLGPRMPSEQFEASRALREAAVLVDRASGGMSKEEEAVALRLWANLVVGRWSLLDWFDSGARRYVVAIRNPPGISDPHRLTGREVEVAGYAALGESGKLIGSRLGLSNSRVSGVLHDVKRKLRVSTQAELVEKMRSLGVV